MEKEENSWLKFLKQAGMVLGFIAFLFATFIILLNYFEADSEREVQKPTPDTFRIYVSSEGNGKVIRFEDLEAFKKEHPNYSFIVSKADLLNINKMVEEQGRKENPKSIPRITVENEFSDKQIIKISHGGDGIFTFRYEAREKDFKPLTTNIQGPGAVFPPCIITGIVGFVIFYLLRFVLWYQKRKQKKFEEIGE